MAFSLRRTAQHTFFAKTGHGMPCPYTAITQVDASVHLRVQKQANNVRTRRRGTARRARLPQPKTPLTNR